MVKLTPDILNGIINVAHSNASNIIWLVNNSRAVKGFIGEVRPIDYIQTKTDNKSYDFVGILNCWTKINNPKVLRHEVFNMLEENGTVVLIDEFKLNIKRYFIGRILNYIRSGNRITPEVEYVKDLFATHFSFEFQAEANYGGSHQILIWKKVGEK